MASSTSSSTTPLEITRRAVGTPLEISTKSENRKSSFLVVEEHIETREMSSQLEDQTDSDFEDEEMSPVLVTCGTLIIRTQGSELDNEEQLATQNSAEDENGNFQERRIRNQANQEQAREEDEDEFFQDLTNSKAKKNRIDGKLSGVRAKKIKRQRSSEKIELLKKNVQHFYSSQSNENLAEEKLEKEFNSNDDGDVELSKDVSSTPELDIANEQNYKMTDLNLESQQPQNLFPDFSVSVLKFQDAIESFTHAVFNDAFDTMLGESELQDKEIESLNDPENIAELLESAIIEKLCATADGKTSLAMDFLQDEDVIENISQAIDDQSIQKPSILADNISKISGQQQENKDKKEILESEIIEKLSATADGKTSLSMDFLQDEDVIENIAQAIDDQSIQKPSTLADNILKISGQQQENKDKKESTDIHSEKQNNPQPKDKDNSNITEKQKDAESSGKGPDKKSQVNKSPTLSKPVLEPAQEISVNTRFAELKGKNLVKLENSGVALVEETFTEKVAYKVGNEGEYEIPVEETFCEIITKARGADIEPIEVIEECFSAKTVKKVGEDIIIEGGKKTELSNVIEVEEEFLSVKASTQGDQKSEEINSNKGTDDTFSLHSETAEPEIEAVAMPQMGEVESIDVIEDAKPTDIQINFVPDICVTMDDLSAISTIPNAEGWVTLPIIRGHSDSEAFGQSAVSIHELSDSEVFGEESTMTYIIQEYEDKQEKNQKKHSVPTKVLIEFEDVTNTQQSSNSEETLKSTEQDAKVAPVEEKTVPTIKEMQEVHIAFSRNIENDFEETKMFDEKFLDEEKAKLIHNVLGLHTIEAKVEEVLEYECKIKEEQDSPLNETIPSYELHIPVTTEHESEVQITNANCYPSQDNNNAEHLYSTAFENISEEIPNVGEDDKYYISEPIDMIVKDHLGEDHETNIEHENNIDHEKNINLEKKKYCKKSIDYEENIELEKYFENRNFIIPEDIEFHEVSETFAIQSTTNTEHDFYEDAIQITRGLVKLSETELSDSLRGFSINDNAQSKNIEFEVNTFFSDTKSESTNSNQTKPINKKSLNIACDFKKCPLENLRVFECNRENTLKVSEQLSKTQEPAANFMRPWMRTFGLVLAGAVLVSCWGTYYLTPSYTKNECDQAETADSNYQSACSLEGYIALSKMP